MTGKANNTVRFDAYNMDLVTTLFCGQSFSWEKVDGDKFAGVAGEKAVYVWKDKDSLFIKNINNAEINEEDVLFWRQYFALDLDYIKIKEKLCTHDILAECVAAAPGVQVLRQPFFDTLLSFIVSQNNHIPRITKIVKQMRKQFGKHIAQGYYTFPSPDILAEKSVEDLAELRAGFRAKYLVDAARKVASGEVSEKKLCILSNEEARRELCKIHGVGPKVADCVLLFSFGRWDVVPMDVWMKRAMETHFSGEMPQCADGIQGIAQQYIFHWMRTKDVK